MGLFYERRILGIRRLRSRGSELSAARISDRLPSSDALIISPITVERTPRVPIQPDGSAGAPEVFASSPALVAADGMAFDVHGSLYVAVNAQNTIVRVSPDGTSITPVATVADGLDFPAAVAFGTHPLKHGIAFVNRLPDAIT